MKKQYLFIAYLFSISLFSQQGETSSNVGQLIITPEIMAGVTADSNSNFPEHSFQKQLMVNFGWEQDYNPNEWAQRLKGPRTGIGVGLADFGNLDSLGIALTVMPFFEFNAFRRENLKVQVGMGASYFNKQYDPVTNPDNKAITTDITWSFRLFMNYQLLRSKKVDWLIGAGYFHHSNGHTRLPNQGYNSFLFSLSADIKNNSKDLIGKNIIDQPKFENSVYDYVSFRTGFGINVLSKVHSDKKEVYTLAGEYGKVLNNTFKVGVGFYYRFYQTYYDYIVDDESLVQDGREFDYFKEDPWRYATNLGLAINGEFLLNHIGIEVTLGFNIHKPAYAIDWRINQGWSVVPRVIPADADYIVLGEFDTKYKVKHIVSARLGLKYYLIGTHKAPRNNFYLGAHINTNLGQADFTELNLGYVHNFNFKN